MMMGPIVDAFKESIGKRVIGTREADERCEWCDHCLYVGDGGFWCDEKEELIADNWDFSEAEVCPKYER